MQKNFYADELKEWLTPWVSSALEATMFDVWPYILKTFSIEQSNDTLEIKERAQNKIKEIELGQDKLVFASVLSYADMMKCAELVYSFCCELLELNMDLLHALFGDDLFFYKRCCKVARTAIEKLTTDRAAILNDLAEQIQEKQDSGQLNLGTFDTLDDILPNFMLFLTADRVSELDTLEQLCEEDGIVTSYQKADMLVGVQTWLKIRSYYDTARKMGLNKFGALNCTRFLVSENYIKLIQGMEVDIVTPISDIDKKSRRVFRPQSRFSSF